jgi:hypothetical protein
MEDPDINPRIYSQLIFDKRAPNTQWRKDSLFNKCYWENCISTCRRLKLDPCLLSCIKILSKCKQLQEVVGDTLEQIGRENDFLSRTQKAQYPRERMNK